MSTDSRFFTGKVACVIENSFVAGTARVLKRTPGKHRGKSGEGGGGGGIYYSVQKIKLHPRSLLSLLLVHYSMFVSLAARVCLNIFFTLDMIILQLLDS